MTSRMCYKLQKRVKEKERVASDSMFVTGSWECITSQQGMRLVPTRNALSVANVGPVAGMIAGQKAAEWRGRRRVRRRPTSGRRRRRSGAGTDPGTANGGASNNRITGGRTRRSGAGTKLGTANAGTTQPRKHRIGDGRLMTTGPIIDIGRAIHGITPNGVVVRDLSL